MFVDSGHVVDDGIHVGSHTDSVATTDHVAELLFASRASDEFIGNRLVAFPPRAIGNDDILSDGRYLG